MPTLATSRGHLIKYELHAFLAKETLLLIPTISNKDLFSRVPNLGSGLHNLVSSTHSVQMYSIWSTGESVWGGLGWRNLKTATQWVPALSHGKITAYSQNQKSLLYQ